MQALITLAPGVTVAATDLDWAVARASGPGGQHVNTTNSAVQLRVRLATLIGLDIGARLRLEARAGRRLSDDGVLRLDASGERSQFQNRSAALDRLRELVAAAVVVPRGGHVEHPAALPAISSTQVRARLAAGAAASDLLPRTVAERIAERGWYR